MRRRSPTRLGPIVEMCTLVALLAACGDDGGPPDDSVVTTGTDATLANPASVFCVEQGGTVEIVHETAGQVGYCNLPDGTRVEEWEYFLRMTDGTTSP